MIVTALFFLVLFAAILVEHLRQGASYETKRSEQLRRSAPNLGLEFAATDGSLPGRFRVFRLFSEGRWRLITNVLRGAEDDIDLMIFDYRVTTGFVRTRQTSYQTVICLRAPGLQLPRFQMGPEYIGHKFNELLGYQDIDFESHPRFSGKFLLRGDDEKEIRNLFDSELLSFFEQRPGISIEAAYNQVIYYRESKRIAVDDISSFSNEGLTIFARLRSASR